MEQSSILIVDDSPANLKILSSLLKAHYKLRIANGGQMALDIINKGKIPDLILLDIMMPDIDGFSVCKQLKENDVTKDIPVIFISALDEKGDEEKGLKLGAVDYITKPFVPSIVLRRVDTQLKLSHSIQETKRLYNESLCLNKKMVSQNNQIKRILNNSGEGFFVIDKDYQVQSEHSRECDRIFHFEIGGSSFDQVFKDFKGIEPDTDLQILEALFQLPPEQIDDQSPVYLSLLPEETEKDGLTYKMRYVFLDSENEQDKRLMIIIKDISDNKKLKKKMEQEYQLFSMIIKVISNPEDYKKMVKDAEHFFGVEVPNKLKHCNEKTIFELYMKTHTFKGEFGILNMLNIVEKLESFENLLNDFKRCKPHGPPCIIQHYDDLQILSLLKQNNEAIEKYTGQQLFHEEELEGIIPVSRYVLKKYAKILEDSPDKIDKSRVLSIIQKLENRSLHSVLNNYCEYTKRLCLDFGKGEINTLLYGEDIYLNPEHYDRFYKSLIHIFRNIADHGIEGPDERHKLNKKTYGTLICRTRRAGNLVELIISDDGKGINMDQLKDKIHKVSKKSMASIEKMSEDDIIRYIFHESISTRNTSNHISGRGIGLSAVKHELDKIGGTIKVKTQKNVGTTFVIKFTAD